MQLINALASVLVSLVSVSLFRDCSYYISNNLLIQPLLCRAAENMVFHQTNTYKQAHNTLSSYILNKLWTYCTHYTSINTSLHPEGLCMLPYVQPTCAQSHQPLAPVLQCNAWWISRCPIWAVMIKRKGLKMKSAGFFLQRRNLVVMAFCTSCSAVLSWATVQHILCLYRMDGIT